MCTYTHYTYYKHYTFYTLNCVYCCQCELHVRIMFSYCSAHFTSLSLRWHARTGLPSSMHRFQVAFASVLGSIFFLLQNFASVTLSHRHLEKKTTVHWNYCLLKCFTKTAFCFGSNSGFSQASGSKCRSCFVFVHQKYEVVTKCLPQTNSLFPFHFLLLLPSFFPRFHWQVLWLIIHSIISTN